MTLRRLKVDRIYIKRRKNMIMSWYEQKAVAILLTLFHLGIKNIKLGPTLPAFITPNILNVLVEHFNIALIITPEEVLKEISG